MKALFPLSLALLVSACTPIPGYDPYYTGYTPLPDYQISPIYQANTPSFSANTPEHYTFNAGGGLPPQPAANPLPARNADRSMTYTQNLGGGYEATSSDGTTYRTRQNLGGGYSIEGSDGSSYQRTQMLGGGYRYVPQ